MSAKKSAGGARLVGARARLVDCLAARSPAAPAMESGLWTPALVASNLGVPLATVTALRDTLCTADDVVRRRGGVVVFTAAGLSKIETAIAERMKFSAGLAQRKAAAKKNAAEVGLPKEDLRVVRIFRGSPRLLADRANGNEVVLIVKDSAMLECGMVLPGCEQGEFCWYYHGRLPRMSGEKQLYFPDRAPAAPV